MLHNRKRIEQSHISGADGAMQNLLVDILDRLDALEEGQRTNTELAEMAKRSSIDLRNRLYTALTGAGQISNENGS